MRFVDAASFRARISALAAMWPLAALVRGPEGWWVTGGGALALHFQDFWRPLTDADLTLCRTRVLVDTLLGPPARPAVDWADGFRAWLVDPDSRNTSFLVDDSRLEKMALSFRQVQLAQGMWRSDSRPDLIIDASDAIRRDCRGIAYLAPELVLLAKSRQGREKDRLDFVQAAARLDRITRARLARFMPNDHPWRNHSAY